MELTNEFEVPVSIEEAWKILTDVETIAPCLPGAELKEVEGQEYRGLVKVKVGPITASYKGAASFEELDAVGHRAVLRAEGRETRGQGNATALVTASLSQSGEGHTKVSVVTELSITGKVAQFGRGVLGEVSTKLLEQFAANLESTVLAPGGGKERAEPAPAKRAPRARKQASPAEGGGVLEAKEAPDGEEAATPEPPASGANGPTEGGQAIEGGQATEQAGPAKSHGDEGAVRKIESPPATPVDLLQAAGPSLVKRLVPYASVAGAIFLLRIVFYALKRRRK